MNFDAVIYKFLNPKINRYTDDQATKHFYMMGKRAGLQYNIRHVYPDFDVGEYKDLNKDLKFKTDIEYERHFLTKGIQEARIYKNINTYLEYEKNGFPIEHKTAFNWIDKIIYINLEKRVDRRLFLLKEFTRLGVPANKLLRIDGVLDEKRGAIGCTKSHIEALTYAIDNKLNNVLVLEDDVNFIPNINAVYNTLLGIEKLKDTFDVIQLTAYDIKERTSYTSLLDKCNYCTMGTGYIVNKGFMEKLRKNMIEGVKKLEETNENKYTMDHYWNILQPKSKWYTLCQRIIYQRKSYSDNEKTVTLYKC
jgi:glycosyl transferase, family 25